MPRAAFTTLGCKVNQYETQRIEETFRLAGFDIVGWNEEADLYVLNSCSVTSSAESKSRYAVRKASRTNPVAKVVVTGCAAQMSIIKGEEIDGAHLIVPNPEKLRTIEFVRQSFPEFASVAPKNVGAHPVLSRTRATVKIQDGCSVMCSYCSIPYTRPGMVSRRANEVVEEIEKLTGYGFKEVVLTGVLIGAYGPESGSGGPDFEDLLKKISEIPALQRIRISSIEMRQVTPRLLRLMAEPGAKIVPHLHIPLQAGDTRVLADMNRPYTKEQYIELCELAYSEVPDLAITTDIMVGFPTESEKLFNSTLEVCEKVGYLKIHAFRFSPRFGTPADRFGDPIPDAEKQRRSACLQAIERETSLAFATRYAGKEMEVLVENKRTREGFWRGLTPNYLTVEFESCGEPGGCLVSVRIESVQPGRILGTPTRPAGKRTLPMAL